MQMLSIKFLIIRFIERQHYNILIATLFPTRVSFVDVCLIISRAHSPGMAAPSFTGAQRFNMSCHSPSARGHSLLASPNSTLNETALIPEMEPILPDLCIEQLWTETTSSYRLVTTLMYEGCRIMTADRVVYFLLKKKKGNIPASILIVL